MTVARSIILGHEVPTFKAPSSKGEIDWHKFIDGSWAMLCSHPADFTPVCTTELGTLASLQAEFNQRGVKVAAISCNDVDAHNAWIKDIKSTKWAKGKTVAYPIIADPDRTVATLYGMLDPDEKSAAGLPMTCRAVFIIGPDKTLKTSILYPATTGRNFSEVLRVIDSLQLTMRNKVATPVNWKRGDKCMVVPTLSDDQAKEIFGKPSCPDGFKCLSVPSGKGYIRLTDDPSQPSPLRSHNGLGLREIGTSVALVLLGVFAQRVAHILPA
mmetsp:Transcript_26662/g.50673  ORF Transcript_26662/g.50673 Transcript_26662/m.50673 type:complete len:270 (-) Transcript_26662:216-1025(-)